jgi:heat shock protein HslJ
MPDLDLLDRLAPDVDTDAGLAELGRRRRRARRQRRVLPALVATIALVVLAGGVLLATRPTPTDPELDPADQSDLTIVPDVTPAATGDPLLVGTEWMLQSWSTPDGVEHEVPEETILGFVSLGFLDETIAVTTGCNDLSGPWALDGEAIVVERLETSGLSCGGELASLEQEIIGVLLDQPVATLEAQTLVLTSADGPRTLTYTLMGIGRSGVEQRQRMSIPLTATSWQVELWTTGSGSESPTTADRTVLSIDPNGTLTIRTECLVGTLPFTIEGNVLRTSSEPEGDCTRPRTVQEEVLLSILRRGATVQRGAGTLQLEAGNRVHLIARVVDHPIVDRSWRVTSWSVDGIDHDIAELQGSLRGGVPGLRFQPNGRIDASAGCNSLGALYSVSAGELAVSSKGGTNMACDGAVMELEHLMLELLSPGTDLDLDGDQLLMRNGDTSITFTAQG